MRLDRYPNNLHLTTTEVKKKGVVYIILGSLYYDDYVSTSFEQLICSVHQVLDNSR